MRRFTSGLAVLATLALAAGVMAPAAAAKDDKMAAHPIVGAWIIESSPDDPTNALELVVIGPGGTITDASADGTGLGAWSPTGERTADATFDFPSIGPDGAFVGFVTVRASVEVAKDGSSFSGTYTLEFPAAMAEAMGMTPGQMGPGDVTAQRITVDPMGEVVGPIPPDEPAAESMPEASPAA